MGEISVLSLLFRQSECAPLKKSINGGIQLHRLKFMDYPGIDLTNPMYYYRLNLFYREYVLSSYQEWFNKSCNIKQKPWGICVQNCAIFVNTALTIPHQ